MNNEALGVSGPIRGGCTALSFYFRESCLILLNLFHPDVKNGMVSDGVKLKMLFNWFRQFWARIVCHSLYFLIFPFQNRESYRKLWGFKSKEICQYKRQYKSCTGKFPWFSLLLIFALKWLTSETARSTTALLAMTNLTFEALKHSFTNLMAH